VDLSKARILRLRVPHADEIRLGRAGGDVGNPARGVERHPAPAIGPFLRLVPRLGIFFARLRNGVESPEQLAGEKIVTINVLVPAGEDDRVLVNGGGDDGFRDCGLSAIAEACDENLSIVAEGGSPGFFAQTVRGFRPRLLWGIKSKFARAPIPYRNRILLESTWKQAIRS
jgi:hypothetical protein